MPNECTFQVERCSKNTIRNIHNFIKQHDENGAYIYAMDVFASVFLGVCFFVANNRHGKPKNPVYIEKKNVDNEKKMRHESEKDYAKKPYLGHNNVNCDSG